MAVDSATANKQLIGILMTAAIGLVICLFQFAILDQIRTQGNSIATIQQDVSSLKTGRADDASKLDGNSRRLDEQGKRIDDLEKRLDDKQDKQIDGLRQNLKAKSLALQHQRLHTEHEEKALTDLVVGGVKDGQ